MPITKRSTETREDEVVEEEEVEVEVEEEVEVGLGWSEFH